MMLLYRSWIGAFENLSAQNEVVKWLNVIGDMSLPCLRHPAPSFFQDRGHTGKNLLQKNGYGTQLLEAIEKSFPERRYELFTSTRSKENIRLYQKAGYRRLNEKRISDELVFVYMEKC